MKVTKRLLTILLSVCLIMSMFSMTAFAIDARGSITIKNQEDSYATIEGKTLKLFKIFDATTDGTNISYQWIPDVEGNLYESVFFGANGITGKTKGTIHDVATYIEGLKNDSAAFSRMATAIHDYIHERGYENNPITLIEEVTISKGTKEYKFDNLQLGYYMIYDATEFQNNQEEAAVRSAAMLVHPGENKVVYLKADRPHIEKYVNDGKTGNLEWKTGTTASINDTVKFKIKTAVPNHDAYGEEYTFIIKDKLPAGLDFVGDEASVNVSVTVLDNSGNIKPAEVTIESETKLYNIENKFIEVELNEDKTEIKVTFKNITLLNAGTSIEITYDAIVSTNAEKINTNTATLTYSNDPHNAGTEEATYGSVSDSANVYLWRMILTKYMEDSIGTPSTIRLTGAQFSIYDENNKVLKFTKTTINNIEGYVYDPANGDVTLLDTSKGTSDDDGKKTVGYEETDGGHLGEIVIWGLGEGTYVIEEITAPAGYQIAKGKFQYTLTDEIGPLGSISDARIQDSRVEANENDPGKFTRVTVDETRQAYYLGITNRPGSALPETGGIGSTIYMVAGLAIMVSAAAVLVYKKRNSAK